MAARSIIHNSPPCLSFPLKFKTTSISCRLSSGSYQAMGKETEDYQSPLLLRPDSFGRFGIQRSTYLTKQTIRRVKYTTEALMHAVTELEDAYASTKKKEDAYATLSGNHGFQEEQVGILSDYVGGESPLYFAKRLTEHYKRPNGEGPHIYLKREDLNHNGAHKINNAIAEVRAVHSGTATLKDATSEAIHDWVTNVESTHYILGSVAGLHPYPMMVREFHAITGKEIRKQALEKWGGKPDVLVACVGGGSNAMGLFHEFVDDKDVRLIGVEAAGFGLDSGKHAATLTQEEVGVLHGAMSYLLLDDDGQIIEPHPISAGLVYPPEQTFLKDIKHAENYSVTCLEALEAFKRLSRLEEITPAQETSHALAYLEKLCPTLPNGTKLVLLCSGRGDKDVHTAIKQHLARMMLLFACIRGS